MKFYTYDWWCGCQGPEITTEPHKEYRKHLESIRGKLSDTILRLEDEVSLHDGSLIELIADTSRRSAVLRVDGDDGRGGLRRFTLEYQGVTSLRSRTNGRSGLSGPAGYGDLGYWEADLAEGGFEHRFLFSTGIELEIVFASLDLHFVDGVPPR